MGTWDPSMTFFGQDVLRNLSHMTIFIPIRKSSKKPTYDPAGNDRTRRSEGMV